MVDKSLYSLAVLSLVCLTWGWQPGTQYTYKFVGRSVAGIYGLKQQNAVVELHARAFVQSTDENTIVVKLADGRIKRNGNYLDNPYSTGDSNVRGSNEGQLEEIDGIEDSIPYPESLGAPFVITHNKGSITGLQVNKNEPEWIVNFKKSIAGQLQLDITGVHRDGPSVDWSSIDQTQGATFDVYESTVTGNCSTSIRATRLSKAQVYATKAYNLGSWDAVCHDTPAWEFVKTKDYYRCEKNPVLYFVNPATHDCTWRKGGCAEFMKRTSTVKYIACGDSVNKITVVHASGFSEMSSTPYGTKSEPLVNSVVLDWILEKKESLGSRIPAPASPKSYSDLTYVFTEFEHANEDGIPTQASLTGALLRSPVPVAQLAKNVFEVLRLVARDLKEQPDSGKDIHERLEVVGRVIPMFSLDDIRALWEQVKNENYVVITLFVDCLVQSGTNPSIMFVKELIETRQITETKAAWALAAVAFFAKTPTRDLFRELLAFLKSAPLQSSKIVRQTAMISVAELIYTACGSSELAKKRWSTDLIGEFCNKKDSFITEEFLPLVIGEIESSESSADRIVGLTVLGTLGVEEILPHLRSHITGGSDNAAERVRAILSLSRVVSVVPEEVHRLLSSVAGNVAERPDVRMAALGLLLFSNAHVTYWQKFATSTWFEPSNQVVTYTRTLIESFAAFPPTTALYEDLSKKGRIALAITKPASFGISNSFDKTMSSYLKEDITIIMEGSNFRSADESLPVFFSNRYFYHFGPFDLDATTIYWFNYNMGDVWQNAFGKVFGMIFPEYGQAGKAREQSSTIRNMWDDLNIVSRKNDKRAGLLHLNLMGGVNRMFNLEQIGDDLPSAFASMMKPLEVSVTKFRVLYDYHIRAPSELGLPISFIGTLPVVISLQGYLKADAKNGLKSDITSEVSGKLTGEIRVDLPWSGNYIAAGVDTRVDSRMPKELAFNYQKGQLQVTWTPGSKVTDLLYYHVKPYTITRSRAASFTPTLEDPSVHLITNNKKNEHSFSLGNRLGVNVRLSGSGDFDWTDKSNMIEWISKWEANSLFNVGFFPLSLENRQYVIRYDPTGTTARSVTAYYKSQRASRTGKNTLVYEAGSSRSSKPVTPETNSPTPIPAEQQPVVDRLFKDIDNGNANIYSIGLVSRQENGNDVRLDASLGVSYNALMNKNNVELRAARYSTENKPDWSVRYSSVRNWNKPPTHGFSKDVLYYTKECTLQFGENCDENTIRFKGKFWRDEEAASVALSSPAGQQCQKDLSSGLYSSPACTKARRLDHTYNNYELKFETKHLSDSVAWAVDQHRRWFDWILYPFLQKATATDAKNPANEITWIIKYDPVADSSDITFVRPTETVVVKNARVSPDHRPFSPIMFGYWETFYPLNARTSWFDDAARRTTGISDGQCSVGSHAISTFDGASYNYTVDGCHHVLLTDCSKKTEIAVLSRRGEMDQQIATILYGKDSIELNPTGLVSVNGEKVSLKNIGRDSVLEIRTPGSKHVKAVVYLTSDSVTFDAKKLGLVVTVQESHVHLSASSELRGRTCGLCGDYDQETTGEWKTASRCALSSGQLMAASFKLNSGEGCSAANNELLMKETRTC